MCPCCSGNENINDLDGFFDEKYQFRHANDYLRNGLSRESQKLIDWVSSRLDGDESMMEIGCGGGMLHHELLRNGKVSSAIGIDASSAGLKAAARNAETLGLTDDVAYHRQDFAQNAEQHSAADLVVMDRVICCYPHLDLLLGQAAEKANRYLAISFPIENIVTKVGIKLASFAFSLFGSGYHPYLHGPQNIRQTAESTGMRLVHTNRHYLWKIMVFERSET
ncbi:MAG: class I SAM-dependent methyltransferase [Anaerolineae bacterium]